MTNYTKESSWKFPFLVPVSIIGIGLILEMMWATDLSTWYRPLNILLLIFSIFLVFSLRFAYPKSLITKFLASPKTTVAALLIFAIQMIVLGLVPQLPSYVDGMTFYERAFFKITHSLPFVMMLYYLLILLLMAILMRKPQFSINYISFVVNHLVIYLLVVCGLFGAPDKKEYKVLLKENIPTNYCFDMKGQSRTLPFVFYLNSFSIDRYPGDKKEVRLYEAIVSIEHNKEVFSLCSLRVNHPYKIGDYYIYLENIKEAQANMEGAVVLKVVKDPWYALAEIALWGMLIGAFFLFISKGAKTGRICDE